MAEKHQHELRKLDEAKEKDLTRYELENNIPRYKNINHNQASRDSIKIWIFPERSISHSLTLFGHRITQNQRQELEDMREDLGAALVQVKEDGCCTDARLGLNLLSGNHWMRVVEDVGR